MIEVSVTKDEIRVLGHSGYAPPGQDIVCAAISTLTQTLSASLDNLTDDNPDYTIAPGVFILKTKDLSAKAKLLVDSFFLGICGVADACPDCIILSEMTLNYRHCFGRKRTEWGQKGCRNEKQSLFSIKRSKKTF